MVSCTEQLDIVTIGCVAKLSQYIHLVGMLLLISVIIYKLIAMDTVAMQNVVLYLLKPKNWNIC